MNKNQTRLISLLISLIFILCFLISGRLWFRIDLTNDKVYTLSEVSKNLFREIADEVKITYFISDKLLASHPLPGEIADLLREYAAHSRGKIRFIERDPAKAGLLREVEELGIVPQQIQIADKNESTVATVYSGILIEYLDREAVIPVAFSLETLEYEISSRVRSLVRNNEQVLGVIVGDGDKQWSADYRLLNQELAFSGFKVRLFAYGEEIPDTLPALFVLGGAEYMDENELAPIRRYIAEGGKVLFAVNGVSVDTRGSLEAHAAEDRGLLAMLANYGIVVRQALVLDRAALTLTYQNQSGNGTFIRSVRYPEWIAVLEEGGNPNHPLTARFGGLDLYWASPLELCPPKGIEAEVLFSSTGGAWLQTNNFITNPNYVNLFEDEAGETLGKKILGASLSGIFPDGLRPARIIVVGDENFAGSLMGANRGEERNLDFLVKAAEWLSSDDDIISIRNRASSSLRLDRITNREKRDVVMSFSRTVNTIVIPLLVIFTGIFIVLKRRSKTGNREKFLEKGQGGDI